MPDLYQILGVSRNASEAEIKRAYRRLAKQHHPDLAPGDRRQAEKFREISDAYEILRDTAKRARYDQTGSTGNAGPGGFGPWGRTWRGGRSNVNVEETFADLFGFRSGPRQGTAERVRGPDTRATLTLDFIFAIQGGTRAIALPDGRKIDVRVPPGIRDGQSLRLRGQGQRAPGPLRSEPGDALVEVRVQPHPELRREGNDIHVDVPISLAEAVLGAKITVPTVDGPVVVTVPEASNGTKPLRLKGRGAPFGKGQRGDQHVFLRIVLPETRDPELEAFVRNWAQNHPYDPRRRTKGS